MTSPRTPLQLAAQPGVLRGAPFEISAYQLLVDSISQSMWVSDADGKALFFNAHALRCLGVAPGELVGVRWIDRVHPGDRDRLVDARRRALDAGESFEVEARLRCADGDFRWHRVRVEPVRAPDGAIFARIGTAIDVHDARGEEAERERLLREVEEQKAAFDAIHAQLPVGLIIIEADSGKLLYYNPEAERLLGGFHPTDDFEGYDRYGGEHPDGTRYRPDEYPIARAARGETLQQVTLLYRRSADDLAVLSVSAKPVRDASGRVVQAVATLVDVTERRAAERELAERDERLRAALSASRTGTFRWDIRTNALDWDENLDRLFGLEPGRTARSLDQFVALVHPDDRARVIGACERCARDGVDFSEQFRVVWPDGTVRWLDDQGRTYRDAEGRPAYMTGACVDINELVVARHEAERARFEAQRANAAKSNFLAMMSHELRTPINAALGYADLLVLGVRGELTEEQHRDVERIRRSQRNLLSLVNEVLDFARIESGRIEYHPEPVALDDVLADVAATAEPLAQAKKLSLDVHPCDGVRAFADRGKTQQIVLNLLSNAVKFTAEGGRIEVSCAADRERARVVVRDGGRGIPSERLESIFEPFVQVDQREDSKLRQGVGLGLAIARQLARGMGGELAVESEVGVGSTFTLTLPANAG
ncbi:MAG TPA: PAS domain-containing protein [Gemmatimonadaceae bacterium]